jgi:hypothetical protein
MASCHFGEMKMRYPRSEGYEDRSYLFDFENRRMWNVKTPGIVIVPGKKANHLHITPGR